MTTSASLRGSSSTWFRAVLVAAILVPAAATSPVEAATDVTAPVVTAPVARLRANATVAPAAIPFRVAWSGTDAGSGIASYRLELSVDGGSWARVALSSAAATSVTVGLWSRHDARVRVRATDRAGNVSPWSSGPVFRVGLQSEAAPGVATTGPWTMGSSSSYLGGKALRSGSKGARLTLSFTGSQVAWFGTRSSSSGRANVYVDGTFVTQVSLYATTAVHRRTLYAAAWRESGPHIITIEVVGTAGHPNVVVDGFATVEPPPADPVLVGAGDIATCGLPGAARTGALLDGIAGRVFAAGDLAYPSGTAAQFRDCYGPTWGRWRLRTSPAPGNHEYRSSGASPYFAYFGTRAGAAGRGWYAYDLGAWRIYTLNANCDKVACGEGSEQVRWLVADLAANPRACVAAVWHQPLFSSGNHGGSATVRPLWDALAAAGADVVLNGHDHDYERFDPQTSSGRADPAGMREFVVGTGGGTLRPFTVIAPNSVVRNAATFGVLRLTLRPGGYDWRFVPASGGTFTDAGSAACH